MASSVRRILLTAIFVFTLLCINGVVTEVRDHSRGGALLETSYCSGYEVTVHYVWTEIQCLDKCFRHPHCDKYIYYGQGNQNCKLLYTGNIADIPGLVDLPMRYDKCAPKDSKALRKILLGTKDCPELQSKDDTNSESNSGAIDPYKYINGGI